MIHPHIYNLQTLKWLSGTFLSVACSSLNNLLPLLRLYSVSQAFGSDSRQSWFCSSSNSYTVDISREAMEIKSIWVHERDGESACESMWECVRFFLCGSVLVLRTWRWNASSFCRVVGPSHQINLKNPTLAWTCLKVSLPFFCWLSFHVISPSSLFSLSLYFFLFLPPLVSFEF